MPGAEPFSFGTSASDRGYAYDLADGLTTLKLPSGRVVSYEYDDAGRIRKISGSRDGATTTYADGIPIGRCLPGRP